RASSLLGKMRRRRSTAILAVGPTGILPVEEPKCETESANNQTQAGCLRAPQARSLCYIESAASMSLPNRRRTSKRIFAARTGQEAHVPLLRSLWKAILLQPH